MNDNLRSQQLNPFDDLFWKSRGYPEKPRNWQQLLEDMGYYDDESDQSSSGTEFSSDCDDTESDSEYEENRQNSNIKK